MRVPGPAEGAPPGGSGPFPAGPGRHRGRSAVFAGSGLDQLFVFFDPFVESVSVREQVADAAVGVAGKVFEVRSDFRAQATDSLRENNAEFGEYESGPRVITPQTKEVMKQILADIQTGEYAKNFILENKAGAPTLTAKRRLMGEHSIEVVGEKLRAMMPWIKANKLVDKTRN